MKLAKSETERRQHHCNNNNNNNINNNELYNYIDELTSCVA